MFPLLDGDAVAARHREPAQLLVLDHELGQSGRLAPPPLDPVLHIPCRPRGLVVSLPREDDIIEAGGRELAVGPRPAAVEHVAEALGAVGGRAAVVAAEAEEGRHRLAAANWRSGHAQLRSSRSPRGSVPSGGAAAVVAVEAEEGSSSSEARLKMATGKMPADTSLARPRPRIKFCARARARHPSRAPSYAHARYPRVCLARGHAHVPARSEGGRQLGSSKMSACALA